MGNTLKRCPFCGRKAYLLKDAIGGYEVVYSVRCKNINCAVSPSTHFMYEKENVIKAWNRRAYETD